MSFGHAKVLAGLAGKSEVQLRLARRVQRDALSVRQLEGLLAAAQVADPSGVDAPARRRGGRQKPPYLRDLEEQLTRAVGTRVTIKPGRAKNGGRIAIEYYSLDDFDRIAACLGYTGAE